MGCSPHSRIIPICVWDVPVGKGTCSRKDDHSHMRRGCSYLANHRIQLGMIIHICAWDVLTLDTLYPFRYDHSHMCMGCSDDCLHGLILTISFPYAHGMF